MPITTVPALVQLLQRYGLLDATQLKELAGLLPNFSDPRLLARELVQRGWLTPHQVNHLFQGKEKELLLGQYVVLDRIGSGGMGAVLKARHRRLKRIDALKVIRKEQLANPKAVQRFQQEAEAVARLKHSNIVAIYDANEDNGTHFLVMEYVEGTDLSQLVKRKGPLPVEQACECIRQAALGLQHAHERGLVHRDIKPANLMLDEQEHTIKVLDMGLARMLSAAESEESTGGLTQTGTIMGTPDYISPEQAMSSHDVDIRTDIYSLGCTLYFLLTGKPPFPGGEPLQKMYRHQHAEPEAVEQLRPEVPPALAAVVRTMMAKKPADRYQTPAEAAQALEPFTQAIPAGTQRRTGFLARPADAVLAPDQTVTGPAAVPLSDDSAAALGYTPTNATTVGLPAAPAGPGGWRAELRQLTASALRGLGKLLTTRIGQITAIAAFSALVVLIALVAFSGNPSTQDKTAEGKKEPPGSKGSNPPILPLVGVDEKWIKETAARPAAEQVILVLGMLQELNPGFDGAAKHRIENGKVADFDFSVVSVSDISPLPAFSGLQVLSLRSLDPWQSPLVNLVSLRKLPLRSLNYPYHTWLGAEPLRSIKTLEKINDQPVAAFWKKVQTEAEEADKFRKYVSQLPPPGQTKAVAVANKIKERNPGFDAKVHSTIENGEVLGLSFGDQVAYDISPVNALIKLRTLHMVAVARLNDLTPLHGMPLITLNLERSAGIRDLTPLHGMPLTSLDLGGCNLVRYLTPLTGMKLKSLGLSGCGQVRDLTPLKGMPLTSLDISGTGVQDLTPLEGMPLAALWLTPKSITKGMEIIRKMPSLKTINGMPAAEFWKRFDAGEFK